MKNLQVLLIVLCSLTLSSVASAQDPFSLSMGVGLKGGINGNGYTGVAEGDSLPLNNQQVTGDPEIYPAGGVGGAIGLHLDVRAFDLVGLETGLHLSYDNADGYEDKNVNGVTAGRDNQTQRTTALHVPLLLKFWVPGLMVRPVFGLGAQFVFQQDSTLEHDNAGGRFITNPRTIETSNYVLGMLTAGLEINVLYVRIPIELRLGYNLGFGSAASDRVRLEGNNPGTATVVYDGAYQFHAALFTGIIYEYDFLF